MHIYTEKKKDLRILLTLSGRLPEDTLRKNLFLLFCCSHIIKIGKMYSSEQNGASVPNNSMLPFGNIRPQRDKKILNRFSPKVVKTRYSIIFS
jgi:hypothetical protein